MKNFLLYSLILFIVSPLFAQDQHFQLRLGINGTGTFDEGIWYFKENQGLNPQTFKFQNSWGIAIDFDYYLAKRITAGVHLSIARTGFQLEIDKGFSTTITKDHTTHNQFIAEIKYIGRPGKSFRPLIGVNAGILFTRNIQLTIDSEDRNFNFINPFIYGIAIGFEYHFGSKGWALHSIIRGQTFEYTTKETTVTHKQRLLDQVWWMNYNHLQFGISKSF